MSETNGKRYLSDYIYQRLHMFLVATAFLVVAFVSLVTSYDPTSLSNDPTSQISNPYLVNFVHAVAALGSMLSLVFLVINYFLALSTEHSRDNKIGITSQLRPMDNLHLILLGLLLMLFNIRGLSRKCSNIHIWLIPFFFFIFWLVAWWIGLGYIGFEHPCRGPIFFISGGFLLWCFYSAVDWMVEMIKGQLHEVNLSTTHKWLICIFLVLGFTSLLSGIGMILSQVIAYAVAGLGIGLIFMAAFLYRIGIVRSQKGTNQPEKDVVVD